MRKFLLALVCLLMLCMPVSAEETFLERDEIPVLNDAEGLDTLGIVKGTENGLELERNVTRAEALTIIWRTTGAAFNDIGYENPVFNDISGHWAYDAIEKFYHAGYINGISETEFAPERNVTGREFVKILLTVMGYEGITIENAYDKGREYDLLLNNFTKSVVASDVELLRSDAVRICRDALIAKTPGGEMLYKTLVLNGLYKEEEIEDILMAKCGYKGFADSINEKMPDDKNYMFSPLSIKTAFAMAANGADGETKQQLLNLLEISDLDEYNRKTKEFIEKYTKSDILTLNTANSIWLNESRTAQKFSEAFKNTLSEYYGAQASTVNDGTAVNEVNSWVKEKTNEKISGIISSNEFWALLVNAVYFKGAWQNEFFEYLTGKDEFTDRNGNKSQIDFMTQTRWLGYSDENGVRIAELPYKNSKDNFDEEGAYIGTDAYDDINVSMYVMVSDNDINAVSVLESAKLERTYVHLTMPKFKIEYEASLKELLTGMGISKPFSEDAEFNSMFDRGSMFITDALHKTYITVDEKGTEAAAVTALSMAAASLPPQPVEFNINKPFTFIIKDNISGEILFMGEYAFAE